MDYIGCKESNTTEQLSLSLSKGFPDSSVGKESICNAGDPGLVRFLGRDDLLEKGIGYLFQYSWAYLVAELVKKLPVMWET